MIIKFKRKLNMLVTEKILQNPNNGNFADDILNFQARFK